MKAILFFISLFLSVQVAAQYSVEVKQLLERRDLDALNKYISSHSRSYPNMSWLRQSNIVGGYQEGVIQWYQTALLNDSTSASSTYHVNLLAEKDSIFYWRFTHTIYTDSGKKNRVRQEELIGSFKEEQAYSAFENAFSQAFNAPVNQEELFLTNVVYGTNCGFTGAEPEYLQKLRELVSGRNTETLRQWLKSPNAEKQLYALRGYRVLAGRGYNLTSEERKIIRILEQKEGTIATCEGCIYGSGDFQAEVAELNKMTVTNRDEWWLAIFAFMPAVWYLAGRKKRRQDVS